MYSRTNTKNTHKQIHTFTPLFFHFERFDIMKRFDELLDTSKAIDTEEHYREMLRECYSDSLKGPFECLDPAELLEMADPTAYRCGYVDYIDSQEWTEYNGDTYETSYLEEIRNDVESELQDDIEELESELDELDSNDSEDRHDMDYRQTLLNQISVLNAEIESLYLLF